jgi:hypothetical protein
VESFQQKHLIAAFKKIIAQKIPNWQKQIISSFLDFLKGKYSISVPVEIKIGGKSKRSFGYADFNSFLKGKYTLNISDGSIEIQLQYIAHEFMHLLQFLNKNLQVDLKNKMLLWKNKPYMTIPEYTSITDYEAYKKIPWEADAITAAKPLADEFKRSKEFETLKNTTDPNLKFIFDNKLL